MRVEEMLETQFLFDQLARIRELQQEKCHEQALVAANEALASDAMTRSGSPGNARIHFLYCKAVALDMLGRLEEAVPIFERLLEDFPGTPEFESSMEVVCSRRAEQAKELLRANPADPRLPELLRFLERHGVPPYWLIHAVASQEASAGQKDLAWQRVHRLLLLSPQDADYLRCALSLAETCGKEREAERLLKQIQSMLEARPYRLELAPLLRFSREVECSTQ